MPSDYDAILESANYIRAGIRAQPKIAMILGTGLGGLAEKIDVDSAIPYGDIPHFRLPTVQDHQGRLLIGRLSQQPVVAMQGRLHYYEGYSLYEVTFPVRVLRELGAEVLIISSAAGGLNPVYKPGDVMLVEDHINLTNQNPLRGLSDQRLGDRFPDMSQPYDKKLLELAESAALERKIRLHRGVYVCVPGPSLETRAETRMLKLLGANCVGMSTVPEVITGVQAGFRILVLAAITNVNIPDCMEVISLGQVIANARVAEKKIETIIEEVVSRLD
jgi:purine-nucleoside phosphorylase